MKNIQTFNDEDSKIWEALETFDFGGYRTDSELRIALFKKLIDSIGFCSLCVHNDKLNSWCKLLHQHTGLMDRCSDFEKVEEDDTPAFDVMVEPFVEEQKRAADAVKINKYTHWSNKNGPSKPKEDSYDGYDKGHKQEEEE
ncbi:Uncharacterised protein [uncultured archaeon]|nr:Uncharacterised protein [uncultured archaeon]